MHESHEMIPKSIHPPPLQAMNHIMEYSRIPGNIVILWWHGQSQLKLDMSMPDHKNSQSHLWMVAWCGLLACRRRLFSGKNDVPGILMPCVCVMHCRRRFFFGKNDVPEIFMPCNSPVEVFLRAAGAFFSAKMTFLRFLWHVMALLRSSYVPQAHFFRQKWCSWDF